MLLGMYMVRWESSSEKFVCECLGYIKCGVCSHLLVAKHVGDRESFNLHLLNADIGSGGKWDTRKCED